MTSVAARSRLCLALAACCLWGCSGPGGSGSGEEGIMLSMEEAMARPPALDLPGPLRAWPAERGSGMGVYYVLSGGERVGPTQQPQAGLRIVLLKGRAELRVGDVVKSSDPGAYAVVPPGTTWSLGRLGPDPVVFSLLVSPDNVPLSALLGPADARP